jgi:hypothetical protein
LPGRPRQKVLDSRTGARQVRRLEPIARLIDAIGKRWRLALGPVAISPSHAIPLSIQMSRTRRSLRSTVNVPGGNGSRGTIDLLHSRKYSDLIEPLFCHVALNLDSPAPIPPSSPIRAIIRSFRTGVD